MEESQQNMGWNTTNFSSNERVFSYKMIKQFEEKRTFLSIVALMIKYSLQILWNEFETKISAKTQYTQ